MPSVRLTREVAEPSVAESSGIAKPKAGGFERFLPRSQSGAVFTFTMVCYSFTFSEITARLIRLSGFWPSRVDPVKHVLRPVRPGIDNSSIIDLLLVSPVIESFIVIGIIELLRRLKFNIAVQILVSVSLICLLHSIEYPVWGLLVAPAFFVDASAYLYWRRTSFWVGAQVIVILHFLSNFIQFISLVPAHVRGFGH
jgi:hypothetical protein